MLHQGILEGSIFFDIETSGLYPTLEEAKIKDYYLGKYKKESC